jgi:hypothetical protein
MKVTNLLVTCIMVAMVCLFGCGKKSGLEGKLVDGKGKPMAGAKVVAKQVQPIKGYEQFEATTGTDGGFKFDKLFPASAYELITYSDGSTKSLSIKTESGLEGQTKILPDPITIRLQFSKDGATVLDTKTGLMWAQNANIVGRKMKWTEALAWAKGLDIGGHKNWRVPSQDELEQFKKLAGNEKPFEYFTNMGFKNVQADLYWTATIGGWIGAWVVGMEDKRTYGNGSEKVDDYYVWPVRSGQ